MQSVEGWVSKNNYYQHQKNTRIKNETIIRQGKRERQNKESKKEI